MSQRKPFEKQVEKQDSKHIPSTREIIESTKSFLKETGRELNDPQDVEHTCPRRKKLAQKNPSAIVVAANNAGKDIPLSKPSADGFMRQAELEEKPMNRLDLLEHAELERQIRDGFNSRAKKIQDETAELRKQGVLTDEQVRKNRTEAAYNWSGGLIHSFLFAIKATAVTGSFVQKSVEMDRLQEAREARKTKGFGKGGSTNE